MPKNWCERCERLADHVELLAEWLERERKTMFEPIDLSQDKEARFGGYCLRDMDVDEVDICGVWQLPSCVVSFAWWQPAKVLEGQLCASHMLSTGSGGASVILQPTGLSAARPRRMALEKGDG